jgi:hypothetical protein
MNWVNSITWQPSQGECINVPEWLEMQRAGELIQMKFFQKMDKEV